MIWRRIQRPPDFGTAFAIYTNAAANAPARGQGLI
jgi:hypothetical protein